jgi:hypothetical protein
MVHSQLIRLLEDMMIVQVSWQWSKARVWLNELPDWPSHGPELALEHLPAPPQADASPRSAALEYSLASCKGRYGALGARFVRDQAGFLIVQVLHSSTLGPVVHDSLAGRLDTVHQGLATEYVDGVREGILTSGAAQTLGSGTLFVGWAAHGLVGSSHYDFAILARSLVQLLVQMPTTEEEIINLIRAEINASTRRVRS